MTTDSKPQPATGQRRSRTTLFGSAMLVLAIAAGASGAQALAADAPVPAMSTADDVVLASLQDTESGPDETPNEQAPETNPAETQPADESEVPEGLDAESFELGECGIDEWDPTPEEIAEMQAENDRANAALKTAFDAAGIEYTEVSETEGEITFTYVEWDYEDDAANAIADTVFEDVFGSFDEGVDGDWELSDDEIAEIEAELKAENEALRAAFDAAGIEYTEVSETEGELTFTYLDWDYEDDAANEVADTVYEELYGPFEDFEDCDFDDVIFDCELPESGPATLELEEAAG